MIDSAIVGWAHTKFGRLAHPDTESLIAEVAGPALADAGLEPWEIDAIYLGSYNNGLTPQDFPSSLVLNSLPQLRLKPAVRVENACATGSAALYAARDYIAAGRGRAALVIGVEKMTAIPTSEAADCLMSAAYLREDSRLQSFAGVFGKIASEYFDRYGDQSDAMALISAKNHRNGVDNPYAHIRRDLGFEYCRQASANNPYVAKPLKRTDCSLISDGAAALVLVDPDRSDAARRAVRFRGSAHVNDFLPLSRRDPTWFEGAACAWGSALEQAGIGVWDLSFVETHDCFTIAELMEYEAMGLVPRGEGARVAHDGLTCADGRLPVNRSGGLKAKGHPIGATGVSMHVLAASQLVGEAGSLQLPKADLGAVFNMGGAAVANYVSILERMK